MMTRTMLAILKVLEKQPDVVGSTEISRQLKQHGVDLTERTVRYHLKILDERGLTQVFGKEGRRITEKGKQELSHALVSGKVGFVISKIETLSYMTTFDLSRQEGDIILNISFFPEKNLKDALKIMQPVFKSPYVMSDRIVLAKEGEQIGDIIVPEKKIGIGTICSVTINGIFLKSGIHVVSKFGGVLQIDESGPSRFTALISYEGSSLDPLEIFIRSKMTDVLGAVKNHSGRILASFREIPVVSIEEAKRLAKEITDIGIGGVLLIGNPNQPLLEMPVGMDKAGMVIVGGLNPVAALEESGLMAESHAMSTLYEYSKLKSFKDVGKEVS
ncbi:MAG: NrpR regulatory domain-containing protein [Nitrospirota bacterium]